MNGRIRQVTGHRTQPLSDGWELAASAPGTIDSPDALRASALNWLPAVVPSTAASSLRSAGVWNLDGAARRFDGEDWWYRTSFQTEPAEPGEQLWLCFDGLATVADVWLNGTLLFSSENMFVATEHRVDHLLRGGNDLAIRFCSLDSLLSARRPRPRWRAALVENQQIRWIRSTLLGRMPGWSPPAAPVGPWRGVHLQRRRNATINDVRLLAGADGRLHVSCTLASLHDSGLSNAEVLLEHDGQLFRAPLSPAKGTTRFAGTLVIPGAKCWWPHTHGEPALYHARILAHTGAVVTEADLGSVGFRSIHLASDGGDFGIHVNGVPVFCRGACWTPLDPVSLASEPHALDRAFRQLAGAGMNMLRVGGTMVYESDAFLDQCDAHGVLLWHDFMFANLNYPEDNAAFLRSVTEEASQQMTRLQGRPCLAVLCGNSEAEQQAAMWAAPREQWAPALFHEHIPALAREACPGVPYVPSSAHEGAFPHQCNIGPTSYFGVGAYCRPLEDARRSEVRFASECLAFANVPEPRSLSLRAGGAGLKVHQPAWKARTPRDAAAGWDFDDIRDFYLARLYRVDPMQLRYSDHDRYLELGRAATGEVMSAVFSEWRRNRSVTRGGLVWFLRDLWPGAGWGLIDSSGTPKAPWHYLRRALAPVAISLSEEGCNGIAIHVVNDRAARFRGQIEVTLYRNGEARVARGDQNIDIAPHAAIEINAAALFEGFLDLSYAFRFGPPSHDVVVAVLRNAEGAFVGEAFHFVLGLPNMRESNLGLTAESRRGPNGTHELVVRTRRLAQSVCVDMEGFECSDNYFHLAPGGERHLLMTPLPGRDQSTHAPAPHGTIQALNCDCPSIVAVS